MRSRQPGKSILVVSQFYHPDITAAAFRIRETAEILVALGHRVTVVTAEPHKGAVADETAVDDGQVTVIRVPIEKYQGGGKWRYIRHYLSFMVNAVRYGRHGVDRPDVVWASSPPLFVGVAGLILARLLGARFTLDIRDLWPDSAVVVGQIRRPGIMSGAGHQHLRSDSKRTQPPRRGGSHQTLDEISPPRATRLAVRMPRLTAPSAGPCGIERSGRCFPPRAVFVSARSAGRPGYSTPRHRSAQSGNH